MTAPTGPPDHVRERHPDAERWRPAGDRRWMAKLPPRREGIPGDDLLVLITTAGTGSVHYTIDLESYHRLDVEDVCELLWKHLQNALDWAAAQKAGPTT